MPAKLTVPSDAQDRAKALIAPHKNRFKVGVVWTGSSTYKGNAFRSFKHTEFLPLADIPGVQLFSLYRGPALSDYTADGTSGFIIDTASTERDFADCAATMEQMDLVITSDTATAHIAGTLGVAVWTVLHWDAFWVWRHTGASTEWYPGMRLFRQNTPLAWETVIAEVESELRQTIGDGQ